MALNIGLYSVEYTVYEDFIKHVTTASKNLTRLNIHSIFNLQ